MEPKDYASILLEHAKFVDKDCQDGRTIAVDMIEAADELARLKRFIAERVADRSTMAQKSSCYHARRVCLEAEKLLTRAGWFPGDGSRD